MKNRREIDRISIADMYGWSIDEVYRAAQAFKALHKRQPSSVLQFSEYLEMMRAAKLRPSMVGKRTGQYHLARINDTGGYSRESSRFVEQIVNQRERKEGYQRRPEFRALMSDIAKRRERRLCPHCGRNFTAQMYAAWHGNKCKARKVYT